MVHESRSTSRKSDNQNIRSWDCGYNTELGRIIFSVWYLWQSHFWLDYTSTESWETYQLKADQQFYNDNLVDYLFIHLLVTK